MSEKENRRIVAAAVEWNGLVFMLPPPNRHHHILRRMHYDCDAFEGGMERQGFLCSEGYFCDRREAMQIVRTAGQIGPDQATPQPNELFSEDLW